MGYSQRHVLDEFYPRFLGDNLPDMTAEHYFLIDLAVKIFFAELKRDYLRV